ncbi:MAG: GspE/PulE family protein [candidate division WOR-3 bacterium]|nr:GspE/PulE family protein [candidate division WOR-3 bacterium]
MKQKKQSRPAGKPAAKPAAAPHKTEEAAKPAPAMTVEDWVNWRILDAVRQRADAIHFEPGRKGLTVRFRIDGTLRQVHTQEQPEGVATRIKKMSRMKVEDDRMPKDGRYGAFVDGREIDFRVSSLPTPYGESFTVRILDRATLIPMDRLGFSPAALTSVREMMGKPRGLVLVTGPAGSGKTTTLYALLNEIGKSDKKVISLEYPIEFPLPNVTQSQIDPRSGYDYVTALRLVARHDPDVVMVGGLDDADTAQAALQTVLGGHVVLSSTHANDAAEAIGRLLGMGIDPLLVATGLEGVIAQRLARRVCPACRQSVAPLKTQVLWLGLKPGQKLTAKGRGCKECKGTGYKGHVGVFAVLPVTEELRDLVLTRPQPSALRQLYGKAEKTALLKDLTEKAKAGLTTVEEVIRMGMA